MPDRRLLGLLGVALVISTIFTGITFNVKYEEKVRFLASTMPSAVQCSEQAIRMHSFDFMVTRDLPDVVVRCEMVIRRASFPGEIPWTVAGLEHKALITHLLDGLGAPGSPLYRAYQVEGEKRSRLDVIDFSDFMAAIVGEEAVGTCDTIYAVEEDQYGNVSFFRGVRGFFFYGQATLLEVKYSSPGESGIFRSKALGTQAEGYPPITEAPLGRIHLQNLTAGDKVHVEVKVNTQNMPSWRVVGETPFCHEGLYRIVVVETGHGTAAIRADRLE